TLILNCRPVVFIGAFLIAVTGISGCGASSAEENPKGEVVSAARANNHLIVFIDKTLSNNTDPEVLKRHQKQLRKLVREHLKAKGDFVAAYAVHQSTGMGSEILADKLDIVPDTLGVGAQTKLTYKNDYLRTLDLKI